MYFYKDAQSVGNLKGTSVTLSSSEAELMALSEATKEIRFIYELLILMKINVKIPIVCCVDNVGAIFMAENVTATPKSKHIDTRAKFETQFVDDGFLKIIFVKTAENVSDMCQVIFMINIRVNTCGQRKTWIDYYGNYFSMPTFTIGRVLESIVYGHQKGQKTDNRMNRITQLISMKHWLYVEILQSIDSE